MSINHDDFYDDDPSFEEDDVGLLQRIPLKIKLASLALISLLGYSMLGSTFASNLQLGTGRVEYGQGITQAMACDTNVTITPYASFANASGASAAYKLTTLKVTGLDAGCWTKDLILRVYDSMTATPQVLYQTGGSTNYDYVRVFDDNGVFNLQSAGLVASDITQLADGFQVNLYNSAATPSVAQTLATSAYKISLESVNHDGALTLVNLPSGSMDFSASGGRGIFYDANAAFDLGTGAFTIDVWAKIPVNSGLGYTFYDAGADVNTVGGFAFWIESGDLKIRRKYNLADITYTLDNTSAFRSQWHHYAAVRNTSTLKFQIFLDGKLVAEGADSSSNITATNPVVGQLRNYAGYGVFGEIRNLRVVKGTALYTGTSLGTTYFTPVAAPLDKVNGTLLLLLAQNSGNATYDSSDNHWSPGNPASVVAPQSSQYAANFPLPVFKAP
jgi:hypothetical protein